MQNTSNRQLLERMRRAYLEGTAPTSGVVVRPRILESWRRSKLHGLDPHRARPMPIEKIENDNQLVRAVRPLIAKRESVLTDMSCGITVTDGHGCVLERWVEQRPFARRLDARGVFPGSGLAESDIGTSSTGIALEIGESAMVIGAEHFADGAIQMSTAGAPIRHPVSRQIIGSINLTCGVEDSSPLMLQWIREVAEKVEDSILETVSGRERALMQRYLRGARDTRHPVMCMDESTIIGNAAAARMMGDVDQSSIWEAASRAVHLVAHQRVPLPTTAGEESVEIVATPIFKDDGSAVGAELRFSRRQRSSTAGAARVKASRETVKMLPGLVGRSAAWSRFNRQIACRDTREPLLLVGEPGTGKTSVIAALAPSVRTLDAQQVLGAGESWLERLNATLAGGGAVMLDGLHLLEVRERELTFGVIADLSVGSACVFAAFTSDAADEISLGVGNSMQQWPGTVIRVPALRERIGDIPILLQALTAARTASKITPSWTTEAVHTLTRVHWIANVSSLGRVVSAVLRRPVGPYIRPVDLPPQIRSMATRRQLSGLDLLEAHAISAALASADGNKKLAADRLGIARSTLYRKVRALGIDLSGAAY